jgi:hypothetical protein
MRVEEYAGQNEEIQVISPFAGLTAVESIPEAFTESTAERADSFEESGAAPFESYFVAESPFTNESITEAEMLESEAREFLEALHDEDFEDALEELMNEGASRALADAQQWSVAPSESEAGEALTQWMAPLLSEWERTIDGFAAGLESANLESISEGELNELLETLETHPALESELFGKIIRGLANKAKSLVKQVVTIAKNPLKGVVDIAKKGLGSVVEGVKGIGKHLIGPLLAKLKRAGLGLLKGVLAKLVRPLTNMLPAPVRPIVPIITRALGIGEYTGESAQNESTFETGFAAEVARTFDEEVAAMLFAPTGEDSGLESSHLENPAGLEVLESFGTFETFEALETFGSFEDLESLAGLESWESVGAGESGAGGDALAQLDDARARLAAQLTAYTGETPVGPIQEFLPAVLAVRPLIKLGLKVTGARDKLIDLLSQPLAALIRNIVGPANINRISAAVGKQPDRMIARAGVGLAFTALGLETANQAEQSAIPGEALASAVEATVNRVLDELSSEELGDPLQVSAAVQRAFAEAASAYLPDRVLRSDLPERETANEGGMWVLMPRSTAPRYRFRKYSRVFAIPISRRAARQVPWSDGGTLEQYLIDLGATRWPVRAELDLYETMPGTSVGHFTRDETLPAGEVPSYGEYQELTPEVAGVLLGEPGLGRYVPRPAARRIVTPTTPGQRYFRVRVAQFPAVRARRPRRQVGIRWEPSRRRMRVAIRLSERRARTLQASLQRSAPAGQRDLPAVLTALREVLLPRLRTRIAKRLLRSAFVTDPAVAAALAGSLAGAAGTGLSTYLLQRGAQLSAAVANSAEGVTIVLTFNGIGTRPGQVPAPEVVAHPGWLHA